MSRYSFTGRMVQGDPSDLRVKTDERTRQPRISATTGEVIKQVYMALAVPKAPGQRIVIPGNPSYEDGRLAIDADARAAWPQFFGQRPQGLNFPASLPLDCINPKFANKIIDGDGFDEKGQPYSANEGWAGCWIIKCSNGFVPKLYEWTASGWQETIHTGRRIKCGDYVTVSGDCVSNQSTQSPGMYMNFDTVSFEQEGAYIAPSTSVDPNAALGTRGSAPAQAGAAAGSGGAPAPGPGTSQTAPGYSGYRDAGAGAAPPPPPAGPQMTATAQFTYDEYIKSGWTEAQMRSSGFLA